MGGRTLGWGIRNYHEVLLIGDRGLGPPAAAVKVRIGGCPLNSYGHSVGAKARVRGYAHGDPEGNACSSRYSDR